MQRPRLRLTRCSDVCKHIRYIKVALLSPLGLVFTLDHSSPEQQRRAVTRRHHDGCVAGASESPPQACSYVGSAE